MKRCRGLGWAVLAVAGLMVTLLAAPQVSASTEKQLSTLLQMSDYIGVDYPHFVRDGQVLNHEEYQEQREFAGHILARAKSLPESRARSQLLTKARALNDAVTNKASGERVKALSADIGRIVMASYKVGAAPRNAPDLAHGKELFQKNCAGCHGAEGRGNGAAAKDMSPQPTNFHDRNRAEQRSVYALYNTLTLGVKGTAMPGFSELSDAQRWALAFYVSQLQYPTAQVSRGETLWQQGAEAATQFDDLADVTRATPEQVAEHQGQDAAAVLAYLRSHPQVMAKGDAKALAFSRSKLEQSLSAYRAGRYDQARQLAVTAYLEGFELVEASLGAVDRAMVKDIERQMIGFRQAIKERVPADQLAGRLDGIKQALSAAGDKLNAGGLSTMGSFLGSFIILAREGLEAILVLAAIFAFLNRAERPDGRRYVHFGWIAALVLGIATWFVSTYVVAISGASREMTEGISALVAAAILLYVGYWLHGKSHSSAWQKFVADKVQGAINQRNLWLLALLAFLAVYREAFETVLFYRAMWTQGDQGAILGGMVAAVAVLLGVCWAIFYFSVRLPIGKFFSWSALLIAVLAVVFVGNGVAALQESGTLPLNPVPFFSLPLLGIHQNAEALAAQLAMVVLFILAFAFNRRQARRMAQPG